VAAKLTDEGVRFRMKSGVAANRLDAPSSVDFVDTLLPLAGEKGSRRRAIDGSDVIVDR